MTSFRSHQKIDILYPWTWPQQFLHQDFTHESRPASHKDRSIMEKLPHRHIVTWSQQSSHCCEELSMCLQWNGLLDVYGRELASLQKNKKQRSKLCQLSIDYQMKNLQLFSLLILVLGADTFLFIKMLQTTTNITQCKHFNSEDSYSILIYTTGNLLWRIISDHNETTWHTLVLTDQKLNS